MKNNIEIKKARTTANSPILYPKKLIPKTGLAKNVRSGLSYSGARNKEEFRQKAQFILQTQGSQAESGTHILNVK